MNCIAWSEISPGILDLTSGVMLIVGDLHGDWEAFTRYVGRFRQLHSRGRADRLLFLGDLIRVRHDQSLLDDDRAILNALSRLSAELGADRVIALLGDRELALSNQLRLQRDRSQATASIVLIESMPLFVRTASGVTFTHAGASRSAVRALSRLKIEAESPIAAEIVGTNCEEAESPTLYGRLVERLLGALSAVSESPAPQRFLVSGHLPINGGYKVATPRQLRIASAACAYPRDAGIYLLLDLAEPIHSLEGLTEHLGSVFVTSTIA